LLVWFPIRWFIQFLSIKVSFSFLSSVGNLHAKIFRKKLHRIEHTIASALEIHDRKILRKESFRYFQNHYVDRLHIFKYPQMKEEGTDEILKLVGIDHLDRALELGKGAIILHGHLGPVQLPLFALSNYTKQLMQIGLPTDEGLSAVGRSVAFRLRLRYESMLPATVQHADTFLRPVFRVLAENGVVLIPVDGRGIGITQGKCINVSFLHRHIPISAGSFILGKKTGAPLLPAFLEPSKENNRNRLLYIFRIHQPLQMDMDSFDEKSIASAFIKLFEEAIRKAPGLWHYWDDYHRWLSRNT